MALPEILEMDPWLEEEEENYFKAEDAFLKSQKFEGRPRENQGSSALGKFLTVAKISFNSYIIFKLLSRSNRFRLLFWAALREPSRFGLLLVCFGIFVLGATNFKRIIGR